MNPTDEQSSAQSFTPAENANLERYEKSSADNSERSNIGLFVLGGLIVCALAVVILPNIINSKQDNSLAPSQELTESGSELDIGSNREIIADTNTSLPSQQTPQEKPWEDSQLRRARKESQDILAKLLTTQQELESLKADVWATEMFDALNSTATEGDTAYQNQSYDQAIELYSSALSKSQNLLEEASSHSARYLELGNTALASGNIEDALAKLEIAALLDPASIAAQQTLASAEVRVEIDDLLDGGQKALRREDFEEALDFFQKAQRLDSFHTEAAELVSSTQDLIKERDFRNAMSNGFSELSQNRLSKAEAHFGEAAKLKPQSEAVAQALVQVEAARINDQRRVALDQAIAFEAQEHWDKAHQTYESLLKEDRTLTAAQIGKIRAGARAKLNADIENILAAPLRLQNDDAWREANRTLTEAKNIVARGNLLNTQIHQLEDVTKIARTKVTLELTSDSETNVEIYRIGALGQFNEQALALYPGKYVIVGKRSGYRDVRHDLVLDGQTSRVTLNVLCDEAI